MSQIPSIVVIVIFMIGLSLILNFIGNTFLELACTVSDRIAQKKKGLNNSESLQYDNTGDDNDLDTSEIPI